LLASRVEHPVTGAPSGQGGFTAAFLHKRGSVRLSLFIFLSPAPPLAEKSAELQSLPKPTMNSRWRPHAL
jgi:hypothetical protein